MIRRPSLARDLCFRRLALTLFLGIACLVSGPISAQEQTRQGVWIRELEEAIELASQSDRDIFIDFAGNESSLPSTRLLEQVLNRPEFQIPTRKEFVLTLITSDQGVYANGMEPSRFEALQETYQVKGYPTIILADSLGRPYAKFVGYHGESVDEFKQKVNDAFEYRIERDQLLRRSESTSGIERARMLHRALGPIQDSWKVRHYRDEMLEVVANDPGNIAELRLPYELQLIRFDSQSKDIRESIKQLDEMLESFKVSTELQQEILFTKAALLFDVDRVCSREVFIQARGLDVNSQLGLKIKRILETAFEEVEPQSD